MRSVKFAKSLDRPVDVFGLRGRWIVIFLCAAGAGVLLSVLLGFVVSSAVGIASAVILVVLAFLACVLLQDQVSYRDVSKYGAMRSLPPCVNQRESLAGILIPDEGLRSPFFRREAERGFVDLGVVRDIDARTAGRDGWLPPGWRGIGAAREAEDSPGARG